MTVRRTVAVQNLFWAGDLPVAMWDRMADDLAEADHLTLTDNARLMARMNAASIRTWWTTPRL